MRKPWSPTVVHVDFAKSYCITASRDVWVMCLAGTAWLTRDGCLSDQILSPGDVTRVSKADAALVTGMPRCRLGITEKREHLADLQGMTTAVTSAAVSPVETAGEIK
ncbi:DUF2917 domain-containing protein [Pelomonas sp. Root1444]|uniref:DUF2917 domain-containing protein n=1 Tax=Pelomonas sp. Root1444 TaxID=1736464 RepID=UPI00138ECFE2|nr:DUF2917 domain-containing protein [Pelomonas sp. Root1444]